MKNKFLILCSLNNIKSTILIYIIFLFQGLLFKNNIQESFIFSINISIIHLVLFNTHRLIKIHFSIKKINSDNIYLYMHFCNVFFLKMDYIYLSSNNDFRFLNQKNLKVDKSLLKNYHKSNNLTVVNIK